jgi:hypothetical protein
MVRGGCGCDGLPIEALAFQVLVAVEKALRRVEFQMGLEAMGAYDRAAWDQAIKILYTPPRRRIVPEGIRSKARRAFDRTKVWADNLPGAEQIADMAERAFDGTLALTFQPALRSVHPERTVQRFARQHPQVQSMDDIRKLELGDCDKMVPPKSRYTVASAAQGGATALAVTGAEVSTTVSGGATAGVIIGAVAADAVASMAMMGRTIGVVASRYGYDVRLPGEELSQWESSPWALQAPWAPRQRLFRLCRASPRK